MWKIHFLTLVESYLASLKFLYRYTKHELKEIVLISFPRKMSVIVL